ncbi:MAG: peptidylprolyl isomerase [Planctomycetota bacterium]|nr:peptidylprolyl isomerase [Planctomycetota bacterium]
MLIAKNTIVTFEYELADAEGNALDSSRDSGPMTYVHGEGRLVPGLESALEGYTTGDHLEVVVEPEGAYGWHDPERIEWLPKTALSPDGRVEVGMRFQSETPTGFVVATVTHVEGLNARVDANHPLAGKVLRFEVRILDVRAVSEPRAL